MTKPIAWMIKTLDGKRLMLYGEEQPPEFEGEVQSIPLYEHPAKTLTDEEITEVIKKIASNNEYVYSLYEDFEGIEFSRVGIFDFARAILRKAQEK